MKKNDFEHLLVALSTIIAMRSENFHLSNKYFSRLSEDVIIMHEESLTTKSRLKSIVSALEINADR